jgi:hypothetical protein
MRIFAMKKNHLNEEELRKIVLLIEITFAPAGKHILAILHFILILNKSIMERFGN